MAEKVNLPKVVVHKASTRGHVNHGWLDSYHSFSFGNYFNESRIHFGALRVLNDDKISGSSGFSKHPHSNMEIISIPLSGAIEHKDSLGNGTIIQTNDIQIMSAGTGVSHSEFNHSKDSKTNFLQIWIIPSEENIEPSYDQITVLPEERKGKLVTIVSPQGEQGVAIHQNAWLTRGTLEKDSISNYMLHSPENGVYAFVLEGSVLINTIELTKRDGAGFTNYPNLEIRPSSEVDILLIEVPMLL